jgi:hypothetical protein
LRVCCREENLTIVLIVARGVFDLNDVALHPSLP